jgi:TRAP-type uncharacterized transport system fused permease subunit
MVEENWLKVAWKAMALGLGLYLIPLAMISTPQLIELAEQPVAAILAMIKVGVAITLVAYGVIVPGSLLKRSLGIAAGLVLLLYPTSG